MVYLPGITQRDRPVKPYVIRLAATSCCGATKMSSWSAASKRGFIPTPRPSWLTAHAIPLSHPSERCSGRCRTRTCDLSRVKVLTPFSPDDSRRRQTTLTRTNDNARRRGTTAHDAICGAFCGADELGLKAAEMTIQIHESLRVTSRRSRCANPGCSCHDKPSKLHSPHQT